ncbi:Alpha/Beta hydrolase protein [Zychaea mexicana]|uniref:Alpha/Beta hydrolase protein n=1 Tax=Zychaea mexicana TaxID=64656 RepID=UPI0022FDD2C3|nr:Alpha/Beta hydrolase protein [Zychaea mexicana]KAI9491891.1 Alpha/Beta hydrolase protein [Zychaea mexicana]
MLVLFQSKLIYMGYIPPGSRHERFTSDKAIGGLSITEQTVWTPDKKQLRGFAVERSDVKQKEEQQQPIIIYFQGNAGNMIHRLDLFNTMLKAVPNATIVGICYRGFGSSSGRASERGLRIDAQTILNHVCSTYDSADNNSSKRKRPIYLYGHSLGGAVAIGLLAASNPEKQHRIHGLIIENTYTSIQAMVQALYPRYTPYPFIAKYFLWNHWPSLEHISKIKTPILLLSSEKDEIVPPDHMHQLYDAASKSNSSTTIAKFRKSTHMDMYQVEPALYKSALSSFIDDNKVGKLDARSGD